MLLLIDFQWLTICCVVLCLISFFLFVFVIGVNVIMDKQVTSMVFTSTSTFSKLCILCSSWAWVMLVIFAFMNTDLSGGKLLQDSLLLLFIL